MKEKKKVRIEEFVYMLIVICVVVFLFYSDCMDKYLYTCQQFKYIMDNNICTCKAEMAVSGKDLIEIGCPKGEIIGTVLDELLAKVLDNPQLNERETLLNIASKMF